MSKFAPHGGRSVNQPRATAQTVCQKCLGRGHFIFECKGTRPYVSRPSRTQQLENPRLLAKLKTDGKPSVEVPEEFKQSAGKANQILEDREKERSKQEKVKGKEKDNPPKKKAKRSNSHSSGSESSSESGSSSETYESFSDSGSSSSESREKDRKRRLPKGRSRSGSKS